MIDVDGVGEELWKISKVVGALAAVSVFGGFAVWEALLYAGIKTSNPGILILVFGVVGVWLVVTGKDSAPSTHATPPPPEPAMTPRERYQALQLLEDMRRRGVISDAEADRERPRFMPPVTPSDPPSRRRP